jgi:glutamate synthase domain-containing protein 3
MGSCDGPTVRINGRVGWSCAENLMAGKVVIEKKCRILLWCRYKRW